MSRSPSIRTRSSPPWLDGTSPGQVASESTRTNVPAGTDPALHEIGGIDMNGGLARVAGNKRLYRRLLEQFVAKQADADTKIEQALVREIGNRRKGLHIR